MKVEIVFMPEDGEEPHHAMTFEMPALPRVGDEITIARASQAGAATVVVRRVHWTLAHPGVPATPGGRAVAGTTGGVTVECEFVPGPASAEEHRPAVPVG